MSFYLKKEGFDGFAHWMGPQSQEELQHACDLADYVAKRVELRWLIKSMLFHKDGVA